MIHRKPASLALLALSAVALTSCASLGGNVKGDFLCRAPGGSCAPSIPIQFTTSPPNEGLSFRNRRISRSIGLRLRSEVHCR